MDGEFLRPIDGKTPLLSALINYDQGNYVSFDMPGHKHGSGVPAELLKTLGGKVFALDKTTVIGGHLDALHAPKSVIKEAHDLLADCFGAAKSYYLFNGSATGLQILFFVTCQPGDEVLIDGDVDPQTVLALIISGVKPVFCSNDQTTDPLSPVATATLENSLKNVNQCRMVYLRGPSKYGKAADLSGWRTAVSDAGAILAVDECFGAHFKFHPDLPPNALNTGADLVIHSNRFLPFPRQTGILHYGASHVAKIKDQEILDHAYRLFTSTSASYIMLGDMDGGRCILAERGRILWEEAITQTNKLSQKLKQAGFYVISGAETKGWDPCRILIWLDEQSSSARIQLKRQCGILAEQMDGWLSLVIVPGTSQTACDLVLKFLLKHIRRPISDPKPEVEASKTGPIFLREQVLSPFEAWYGRHRRLPIEECGGEICGELVGAGNSKLTYLVPGQLIKPHHLDLLKSTPYRSTGLNIVDVPYRQLKDLTERTGDNSGDSSG